MNSKTYVITGASSGVGASVVQHLSTSGHDVVSVSRRRPAAGLWVEADLAKVGGIAAVQDATSDRSVDGLIFCAGIWEPGAFSEDYRFESTTHDQTVALMNINLIAPIELTKALLPSLRKSDLPKVVMIGSTSGLDNSRSREVANTASKFGVRGATHALRHELRPDRIAFTVINPGDIATPEVLGDLAETGGDIRDAIPIADLLRVVDCVLDLSNDACIKEIDLPAMSDLGA